MPFDPLRLSRYVDVRESLLAGKKGDELFRALRTKNLLPYALGSAWDAVESFATIAHELAGQPGIPSPPSIRHVAVHAAGIATADFVKRHPGVVAKAGDRLRLRVRDLQLFIQAVGEFVDPTELFFTKRFPSLLVSPPEKPAK